MVNILHMNVMMAREQMGKAMGRRREGEKMDWEKKVNWLIDWLVDWLH